MMGLARSTSIGMNPFSDVKAGDYFTKRSSGRWRERASPPARRTPPSGRIQPAREQCVTFLWRSAGKPGVSVGSQFTDVKADAYYAQPVYWALNNGITTGQTATSFGVGKPCTLLARSSPSLYRYAN